MNRVWILCCVFLWSTLSGCQSVNQELKQENDGPMAVIIEGGGEFPQFLVGTWKSNKHGWEFVFEPDGTISSMIHTIGRVRMKIGETTTIPMKKDGKGVFEPGEWMVYYAPTSRELTVKIFLKSFYTDLGDDVLEGKSTDVFIGPISENGKFWQVDWVGFPEYIATTDVYKNYKLPFDPNDSPRDNLIFEKVTAPK